MYYNNFMHSILGQWPPIQTQSWQKRRQVHKGIVFLNGLFIHITLGERGGGNSGTLDSQQG
jgi:hypothetical protein